MKEVGNDNIPISGSKAAAKRKERLEFQVPPHDLDASLCHNLSEHEAAQLSLYVEKIKENSVGQGVVVRIGNTQTAIVDKVRPPVPTKPATHRVVHDRVLSSILSADPIENLLQEPSRIITGSRLSVSTEPMSADFDSEAALSAANKSKLRDFGVNTDAVQSFVTNEPTYEKIFDNLKKKRVRFEDDCLLGPIHAFRDEYTSNESFKNDMQRFVHNLLQAGLGKTEEPPPSTVGTDVDIFNSPLPVQKPIHIRQGAIVQQETPARKIHFDQKVSSAVNLLPIVSAVQRDKLLHKIFCAEPIRRVIYYPTTIHQAEVIVSDIPMESDFDLYPMTKIDIKQALESIGVDSQAVQSGIINGQIYDKLFDDLDACQIDYSQCQLLQPLKALRSEYLNTGDDAFRKELDHLATILEKQNPIGGMTASASNDSGFDSQPPTPNYATHPFHMAPPRQTPVADNFNFVALLETLDDIPPPLPPQPKSSLDLHYPTNNQSIEPIEEVQALKVAATCKLCLGDIYAGTVAVRAERAGKEVAWHAQCFKCHECGDLLADLVYFYHGGNIYCGRDLAHILNIPRCKACDELIFTKEYTAAEGSTFHIKHFCCYQCDIPLAGKQYVPEDGTNMPLCLNCYDAYHAAKCAKCLTGIGPTEQGVNCQDIHWHMDCFVCAGVDCGQSLIGGKFCIREKMPFCSPKCVASRIVKH